jgi:MFS transporter, DHA1 family, inner membrane transport protein
MKSASAPEGRGKWAIVSMVLLYVLGGSVFAVLPLLVGATVELLGFSGRQAGLIGGADMFGATLSALGVSLVVPRGRWRLLIYSGLLCLTLANVAAGLAQHFPALLLSRFVGGLGEGVVLTIATVSIAETRNPDRIYGFAAASLVAYGSPALYLVPSLLHTQGLRGVFWLLAALTTVAVPLVRFMPDRARVSQASPTSVTKTGISAPSVIGLAGVFAYFTAQGGLWAYLDRIGAAHHIEAASVGVALALSAIAGLLGGLLASWLDVRYGRLRPLLCAAVGTAVALLILNESATFAAFFLVTALNNFCWNVSIPYQLGALAELDSTRRTVALSGVLSNAGLAAGPMVAAAIISEHSVQNVAWMGMAFTGLSSLLFAMILVRRARTPVVDSAPPSPRSVC